MKFLGMLRRYLGLLTFPCGACKACWDFPGSGPLPSQDSPEGAILQHFTSCIDWLSGWLRDYVIHKTKVLVSSNQRISHLAANPANAANCVCSAFGAHQLVTPLILRQADFDHRLNDGLHWSARMASLQCSQNL